MNGEKFWETKKFSTRNFGEVKNLNNFRRRDFFRGNLLRLTKISLNPFKFLFIIYLHLSRNQFKNKFIAPFLSTAKKVIAKRRKMKKFQSKNFWKRKIFCKKSFSAMARCNCNFIFLFTQQSKPTPLIVQLENCEMRLEMWQKKFHFDCGKRKRDWQKKFFIFGDDTRFNENCFSLHLLRYPYTNILNRHWSAIDRQREQFAFNSASLLRTSNSLKFSEWDSNFPIAV
jgi:hypothetical protein